MERPGETPEAPPLPPEGVGAPPTRASGTAAAHPTGAAGALTRHTSSDRVDPARHARFTAVGGVDADASSHPLQKLSARVDFCTAFLH